MVEFWKNEWSLFKLDVQNVKDFLTQPVEITLWGKSDLMLKPSVQEIEEKADTNGFWKNEWDLFKADMGSVRDFLNQPVTLK
jgi:hypothetical protein